MTLIHQTIFVVNNEQGVPEYLKITTCNMNSVSGFDTQ